jgi:hypothetical protein
MSGLTTTMALMRRPLATAATCAASPSPSIRHDDPEALSRYAERHGADPARWLFLTGEHDAPSGSSATASG